MQTTLSKKKEDLLYDSVHKKVMNARIEIIMTLKNNGLPTEEIDAILYKLCQSAPETALHCFETTKK
jgi:DNA-binding transcriptional MerR regulator